jgi:hypothetical protein
MLTIALLLAQATPITKIGHSCPFGYYSQSGYCVPMPALEQRTQSIPRSSESCPFGTYRSGNYCTWTPNH